MPAFRLLAALLLMLPAGLAAAEGTITVTGRGEASAVPDMATLQLGVTSQAKEAGAAMAGNAEAMSRVIAQLESAGIDARDMQTSSLSLSPRRAPPGPDRTPEIVGFVASNVVTVRVRDLNALGGILAAALGDGANTLGGLSFGVSDETALREAARRAAVTDAMAAARVLADAAGVALGEVEDLSELSASWGPQPMGRMEMAMSDSVPVAAGESTISSEVRMVFEIGD